MGLNKLDFLSPSPKGFIFQQNSNKTNLGGVLFLIYLLLFFILFIYYISLYALDDNYSIEYLFFENILDRKAYIKRMNDERYNPLFNTYAYLFDGPLYPDNRFVVIDLSSSSHPIFHYPFFQEKRFSNFKYIVAYDCLNNTKENCTIDKNISKNGYLSFLIRYNGFVFDHQNKTSPLYRTDLGIGEEYLIFLDKYESITNKWSIVKYREEKGFFSIFDKLNNKDDEDYGDYIGLRQKSSEKIDINDPFYFDKVNKKTFIVLEEVSFVLDLNYNEEYKRIPKSLLDTLANICSISMTIYNGFCLIFSKLYSNNFDNYKIIEKILFKGKKDIDKNKTNNKIIELRNDFNLNKTDSLIDESNENLEENEKENYQVDKTDEIGKKLPKLNFFNFIFNNIYSEKCFRGNYKQKIISKCNEIISKYYSIECLLYNQIRLESLFKDYKWNNPGLNCFKNNELIIQLKNLISSFNDINDINNT